MTNRIVSRGLTFKRPRAPDLAEQAVADTLLEGQWILRDAEVLLQKLSGSFDLLLDRVPLFGTATVYGYQALHGSQGSQENPRLAWQSVPSISETHLVIISSLSLAPNLNLDSLIREKRYFDVLPACACGCGRRRPSNGP